MIEKPYIYKKLHEMKLDIICMEIQRRSEIRGLIKKERIGRNTFTEKYFNFFKNEKKLPIFTTGKR